MKILSLMTHPRVIPNPWDLHSSAEHKLIYFWWNPRTFSLCIDSNGLKAQKGIKGIDKIVYMNLKLLNKVVIFVSLNVVDALLSLEGQKALGFHQKYLNLCSEDEQRSFGFGTAWGSLMTEFSFLKLFFLFILLFSINCHNLVYDNFQPHFAACKTPM